MVDLRHVPVVFTPSQVPRSKKGRAFIASPRRLIPQCGSISQPLWGSSCHWILDENLWDFLINLTISPTVATSISVGCKLVFPILLFLALQSNCNDRESEMHSQLPHCNNCKMGHLPCCLMNQCAYSIALDMFCTILLGHLLGLRQFLQIYQVSASRGRLPHCGAISRSPAASLKYPASLALNLVSWFSAK